MSKSIHLNQSWQTRSANFSTHGSRNGNNLLGWGEKEWITTHRFNFFKLTLKGRPLHERVS